MVIILAFFGVVIAGEGEEEFHCTFGALGLLLLIITFGSGFLLSGRFGDLKPFRIHKYGTILISLYFTGEFVYGFMNKNWYFVINIHSIVGLLIPMFAWSITVLSPCFAGKMMNTKTSSKVHIVLAIILILLVIIQILYGYLFFE
jgi:accessory gene regulator protein AgrB